MSRTRFLTFIALLLPAATQAQDHKQIVIQTRNTALVFSVGKDNRLYQSYLGGRFADTNGYKQLKSVHEAFVPSGTTDLFEPAISVVHADGNPSLALHYVRHQQQQNGDTTNTTIVLADPVYSIAVEIIIKSFTNEDVITYHTRIVNHEHGSIKLSAFASAMLQLNAPSYWLTQFHGNWASEMHMKESELTSGIKVIDSKLGTRAAEYQTPVFFLSKDHKSTEDEGECIAGTLAWTGNFKFSFEIDPLNTLRLIAGINPYGSAVTLAPGKTFITPDFIFSYSSAGKGQASRNLQAWARHFGVYDGEGPRMTLLNNWETTYFDFDQKKLDQLFGYASKLGVDLFLLDDGWFGNKYPRNSDEVGLGDWQANKQKLPDGLPWLIKRATEKNVKFGIWLEPEMVNPKSELYEKHPDWILKLPNRPEDYSRNQLVLDLINPKVQDFVYQLIDGLLQANPGIAYIKWDCNRFMTNAYSPYLKKDQSSLYIAYVQSLYLVLDRIRAKYPRLEMMLCSSGGGRADYGALKYFQEFWPSDDTDGLERVYIQWGYSYFFPANTLSAHVTSWGKQSLKFRTDVAMMGRLGFDLDVTKMDSSDLRFAQQAVANYKRLSPIIWKGDVYRLVSPYEGNRAALLYADTSRQHAIVFCYNLNTRFGETFNTIKLKGLTAGKAYKVEEVNMKGDHSNLPDNQKTYTGEYLMKVGLDINDNTALSSHILELTAQ